MILTKEKILEEMQSGRIKITPFDLSQVGPASVDLHLGRVFRRFKILSEPYHVTDDTDYETITEPFELQEGEVLFLKPGETVLGITEECITIDSSLCGWLEGRSRFARVGLSIHITASFMSPGIDNKQVLEISNLGPNTLALHPGVRISQFIFQRCDGNATYKGRFVKQKLS